MNPSNQENIATDTACHSEYPLVHLWIDNDDLQNELGKEDECNAYWSEAERVMAQKFDNVLKREFQAAHRILINGKYCYKSELWKSKGWCKLADNMKWGFCSSSCKIQFMKVYKINGT